MRCPYCQQNIRVQGRFCPKCGEQIFGLPVRPREIGPAPSPGPVAPRTTPPRPEPAIPTAPPDLGGDSLDIVVETEVPGTGPVTPSVAGAHAAAGDEIGKSCPYCRFPIKPGERVYVCGACKVIHHEDCWRENHGCTTYGCRGAAIAAGPAQPAYGPRPAVHPTTTALPDFAVLQARELEGRANNALWMAILGCFCCPPMTLVGLFMALSLLGEMNKTATTAARPRTKVIGAIVVAAIALLGWLIYLIRQSQQAYG